MSWWKINSFERRELKVYGVIPLRSQSKRFPHKNIYSINGIPLFYFAADAAKKSQIFSKIIISSDSKDYLDIAAKFGLFTHLRSEISANDHAKTELVIMEVINDLSLKDDDWLFLIQATNPFQQIDYFQKAYRKIDKNVSSILTYRKFSRFFIDDLINKDRPRTQDLEKKKIETGMFWAFNIGEFRKVKNRVVSPYDLVEINDLDDVDIDSREDMHPHLHRLHEVAETIKSGLCYGESNEKRRALDAMRQPDSSLQQIFEALPPNEYFIRRNPSPNKRFDESYWGVVSDPDGVIRDTTKEGEHKRDLARQELDFINKLPPGKILDFGCGTGDLLAGIDQGWEKHGVEISNVAAQIASPLGTIFCGDLYAADYPTGYFDVIFMFHVIEHLDDPVRYLNELRRISREGAWLIVSTPDFDSACARRFGSNYRMLHDQTHISLFSNESLQRCLSDCGFSVKKTEFPFFDTKYFKLENLMRLFDTNAISPPFYGNIMTKYCTKL